MLMGVETAVSVILIVTGGSVVAAVLVLLCGSLAALAYHPPSASAASRSAPSGRLAVLVPAHNESALVARCVRSLLAQRYPRDRFRVVVIADNCTDDTKVVAARAGADVLVRDEPTARGKGRALRWAMDRLLASDPNLAAVVVVDADSVADEGLLAGLERHRSAGADVVQAEYLVLEEPGTRSGIRSAAFLLFHRTRFLGRAALGLPCSLVGNGMLFSRRVLEEHPWGAYTNVEDLEMTVDLRLAGIRPVFAADARVLGPAPSGGRAGATQRARWEGGRAAVVRSRLGEVLSAAIRRRDPHLADLAIELMLPPLGLLALLALSGLAVSAALLWLGAGSIAAVAVWGGALAGIAVHVVVGLRAAHAPAGAYRALLAAPWFLAAKLGTYARLSRGLRADRFERTERTASTAGSPSPAAPPAAPPVVPSPIEAVRIGGVRVHGVDGEGATSRIMQAVAAGGFHQVCTVNMQFLVTARRNPDVRAILERSDLNVADGAPVVWLSRLLGRRLPGRVAGADLVPAILSAAAAAGARVFLLGGQDGVAEAAAVQLRERHPGLVVAGVHEPPYAPLDRMDDDAIVARIVDSGADILLVAFGHPKQERWIARNRNRLGVSVAIGVGCCFDLAAGRRARAPRWMQRAGLEWLYRAVSEPRRLAGRYASELGWLLFVLAPVTLLARLRGAHAAFVAEPVIGHATAPDTGILPSDAVRVGAPR